MNEIVYKSLCDYYNVLEKLGYLPYANVFKLLVLIFYRDFVYNDYRGLLSREDYKTIEQALYCIFGSTCLIPYPDYLKMGKLYLGSTAEIIQRIEALEDTDVLKLIHDLTSAKGSIASDVIVMSDKDGE